jgi:hypothetical protein
MKDHLECLSRDGRKDFKMQTGLIWLSMVSTGGLLRKQYQAFGLHRMRSFYKRRKISWAGGKLRVCFSSRPRLWRTGYGTRVESNTTSLCPSRGQILHEALDLMMNQHKMLKLKINSENHFHLRYIWLQTAISKCSKLRWFFVKCH